MNSTNTWQATKSNTLIGPSITSLSGGCNLRSLAYANGLLTLSLCLRCPQRVKGSSPKRAGSLLKIAIDLAKTQWRNYSASSIGWTVTSSDNRCSGARQGFESGIRILESYPRDWDWDWDSWDSLVRNAALRKALRAEFAYISSPKCSCFW